MNHNIKIKENKFSNGIDSPRFVLTYKVMVSELENFKKGFEIISSLSESNDVLLEFNSSLLADDEKLVLFELIIFDNSRMGQMGIVTNSMSLDDIRQRLYI